MAFSLNSVVGFNSTLVSRPKGISLSIFASRIHMKERGRGSRVSAADNDHLITDSSVKGHDRAESSISDNQLSTVNSSSVDSPGGNRTEEESGTQTSGASNGSTVSADLKSRPKRLPLTARERLKAARVLSRYTESKASKSEMGSKVLDALRESDKGKKKSGLPEAPENLFDDSKRGLPKQGWTFQFPGEANRAQRSAAAYDESFLLPWRSHVSASANFQIDGFPSWSIPIQDNSEDKAASVSKSHSQAEKRRRDRINAQLGILRKLIPKSDKMDKAALLGSVIDHVKDLKRKATEVSRTFTIPTEVDEVTVDYDVSLVKSPSCGNKDKDNKFIRASVCCDDRPELFSELIRVLKGLRLTVVSADIASVGGRIKSMLVLCNNSSNREGDHGVSISTIKQSLNVVLSRIASSSMPSNYRIRSKRQRFFLPSHFSQ